jgi:ubiquinone/menaquinone biosynthesis C-methylase UbiE
MRKSKWDFYLSVMQEHPQRCNSAVTEKDLLFLRGLINPLTHPKLLDIGVGEGKEASVLQGMGYDVTGIIWGETNLTFALENYKDVKFINCDMHDLPFDSETFDAVYMNEVFEHSYAPFIFLIEIYSVLKKDGLCYIHGPKFDDRNVPNEPDSINSNWISHHHPSIFPKNVYKQLFEKTGFEIIMQDAEGSTFLLKKLPNMRLHYLVAYLTKVRNQINKMEV